MDDRYEEAGKTAEDVLRDLGFKFEKGRLVSMETGEGFKFDFHPGDRKQNQKRYEKIGEALTEYVYELLEKEGLQRIYIPLDADEEEPRGFFFASADAKTAADLLILIHGSGVVRAGQWARRLIMNDSLDSGTMLPYIRKARARGFGVIVLNGNLNTERKASIRQSSDPVEHAIYVWRHWMASTAAVRMGIVAHSAGGYVTVKLAENLEEDFLRRVRAIAFTDSAHIVLHSDIWEHISQVTRNWVTSSKPLDSALLSREGISLVSAGTLIHEETSHFAIDSVWKFLDEKMQPEEGMESWEGTEEMVRRTQDAAPWKNDRVNSWLFLAAATILALATFFLFKLLFC